jgi:beta-lactamase class A
MIRLATVLFAACALMSVRTSTAAEQYSAMPAFDHYILDYNTPTDQRVQAKVEQIEAELRAKYGMGTNDTAAGLLDLKTLRLALVRPDREEYAASVAKIGILLAYFTLRPESATNLPPETRHDLGLMVKASSNEMAAKYSHELGLKNIQEVLNSMHFYNTNHGGGIWVGKHYGKGGERYGDPIGDNSHAITVRQVMRFFLLLEQGKLVSPAASKTMRELFASPDIPHDDIKFVKALAPRKLDIIRKWGTWENWFHDSAVITGPGRHYILVGVTHHPKGDDYLVDLALKVDDLLNKR